MRAGLVVCALLAAVLAFPAGAASPVERWGDGDWWEVQMEHQTFHHGDPIAVWTPSFRLRFAVTRAQNEVRVEVTTIPENRFRERLVLRYTPQGELISAQVIDPERVEPLGAAGGFGPFGMLGREAFDLSKVPERSEGSRLPVRVAMGGEGQTVQVWGPDDPWWNQYETPEGLPQRASLTEASWRRPAVREDTVTGSPDGPGLGPGNAPTVDLAPESRVARPGPGDALPVGPTEPVDIDPQSEPNTVQPQADGEDVRIDSGPIVIQWIWRSVGLPLWAPF